MAKRVLFPKREVSYTDSDNIQFSSIDIESIVEKIVEDIRTVKFDSEEKVNRVKARIAEILRLHKWKLVEETSSMYSDADVEDLLETTSRGVRKSITNIYKKAKLDATVIRLHDKAVTEETKHDIKREIVDQCISRLRSMTQEELNRINDRTKTLTSAAKSALQDNLNTDLSRRRPATVVESESQSTEKSAFEEYNARTKRLVEKAKYNIRENMQVLLTNPTGPKLQEEIQSEKFVAARITDFQNRFQKDFISQNQALDQTIKRAKDKTGKMLPFNYLNDEED